LFFFLHKEGREEGDMGVGTTPSLSPPLPLSPRGGVCRKKRGWGAEEVLPPPPSLPFCFV